MRSTYEEGQYVKHQQYGLGTIVASDEERTSIDFFEHGTKKFVTSMVVLELAEGQLARKPKTARRTRRPTKK